MRCLAPGEGLALAFGAYAHDRRPARQALRPRPSSASRRDWRRRARGAGRGDGARRPDRPGPRARARTDVLVVTDEPRASAPAVAAGAEVLPDERGRRSESPPPRLASPRALELGAERVLLVPGDCPALEPAEVDALLAERLAPPAVTIVPDRHGTGTNALLLAPPDAIAPAFGAGIVRAPRGRRRGGRGDRGGSRAGVAAPRRGHLGRPGGVARRARARAAAPRTRAPMHVLDRASRGRSPVGVSRVSAAPLGGLPEVGPDDDLAALLAAAAAAIAARRGRRCASPTRWCRRPRAGCGGWREVRAGRASARAGDASTDKDPRARPGRARRGGRGRARRARRADLPHAPRLRVRQRRRRRLQRRRARTPSSCCPSTPTPRRAPCARACASGPASRPRSS